MTTALIFVAVLMLIGIVLRSRLNVLKWLYIPASVVAGAIGLGLIQAGLQLPSGEAWTAQLAGQLSGWPGWLIAVVFAGLLLERTDNQAGPSPRRVIQQTLMVWVIVLGQTAVGLWVTWLVVQRFYDVPNSFAMLIETGFAGGHGTAAAMGQVFSHPSIGLEEGRDLGVMVATVGLVYGIISGVIWINLAVRRGWVPPVSQKVAKKGIHSQEEPQAPIGHHVVDRTLVDPILLQMIWLALAFGIGWGMHLAVGTLADRLDQPTQVVEPSAPANNNDGMGSDEQTRASNAEQQLAKRMRWSELFRGFPLFIYTLLSGWMLRRILLMLGLAYMLDANVLKSLTAVAMDVLVVAAIASLNVERASTLFWPLFMLLIGGFIWTGVCLLTLSRWILPRQHWFQLGLINYGMSTGTTATGFVLLRVVDPRLETAAAEDYALAAPLSAPFIGGGIITVGLPLLVLEWLPIGVSAASTTLVVMVLIGVGVWLRRE